MTDNNLPIDMGLEAAMDSVFDLLKNHPLNKDSDDQVRMRITSGNLKELANVILIADENEEISVDLKQLALGILGTAGWLEKDLPDLEV